MLVKVTPDLSDLLMGHTTWWTYTAMTRIYKHYSFALQGRQYRAHITSMSSYPGMLSSMVSSSYVTCMHTVVFAKLQGPAKAVAVSCLGDHAVVTS